MAYTVEVVTSPARHLAVSRFHATAAEIQRKLGPAFGAVEAYLRSVGVTPSGPAVACYDVSPGGFDVSAGFEVAEPIDGNGSVEARLVPEQEVATVTHVGTYATLPQAYDALREAVRARGLELDDEAEMWEEYRSPPSAPPEETKTVVYWPVKRAS